jgi:hypothetical protein
MFRVKYLVFLVVALVAFGCGSSKPSDAPFGLRPCSLSLSGDVAAKPECVTYVVATEPEGPWELRLSGSDKNSGNAGVMITVSLGVELGVEPRAGAYSNLTPESPAFISVMSEHRIWGASWGKAPVTKGAEYNLVLSSVSKINGTYEVHGSFRGTIPLYQVGDTVVAPPSSQATLTTEATF